MAESIEAFVAKLQEEGVQAGRQEAEKLRADAGTQAGQIISDAEEQAEKIVADARAQGEKILTRSKADLELAARDTVLRLREALSEALRAIVSRGVQKPLEDVDFVGKALHEIIAAYARADAEGASNIKIDVPDEMRQKLVDWALAEMGAEAGEKVRTGIDLHGRLSQAGFEYAVDGGTVEVTLSSVVDLICGLVTPSLRDVIERAAQKGRQ